MHSCLFLFDHFQFTLIHGSNISGPYVILFFTASDFHQQTHSQLSVIFALAQPLHSFCSCFSALPQQHIGKLWTWALPVSIWTFQCHIFFCLSILFIGFLRQEHWSEFAIPSPSGPRFVRTLHYDPSVLGGPAQHGSQLH